MGDFLKSRKKITLNVSGEIFETFEETLQRYPGTLLSDLTKRKNFYCQRTSQYFFNRDRQSFEAILYFYQSQGILSRPGNVTLEYFVKECVFFELPKRSIDAMKVKEGVILSIFERKMVHNETSCRQKLSRILERPESSNGAAIYLLFSLAMIVVSVFICCIETIPSLKVNDIHAHHNPWYLVDIVMNSWFLFEFTLRLSLSPHKFHFLSNILNLVDALAVLPYFITVSLSVRKIQSLGFLKLLRFIRVVRLYRLSKNSLRLKLVGEMIKSSRSEFQVIFLGFTIVVILGASIMFFVEGYEQNSKFTSIPDCLWWALQTITTLGYGDIVPVTYAGKVMASIVLIFGALTVALPLLAIVTKFAKVYSANLPYSERRAFTLKKNIQLKRLNRFKMKH